MASPQRNVDAALKALLEAEGSTFGFFRAVSLLEGLSPDAARVGELGPVDEEAIRFRHSPDLTFHPGDVARIQFTKGRAEITSTFLGLLGSASPLATYFTEQVIASEEHDEHVVRAFYDVLHHRVLSLLYRAWKKHRVATDFRKDGRDAFSRRALHLVGVDLPRAGAALPLSLRLALAPLLASRIRSTRTYELVLRRLLPGVPVHVESFVERRVELGAPQRTRLGVNSELGQCFTIGKSVVDRSARFRVVLGPLGLDAFEGYLPGQPGYERVRDTVLELSGAGVEPELEVHLGPAEAPRLVLGDPRGARLGVTTQLSRSPRGLRARMLLADGSRPLRVLPADVDDEPIALGDDDVVPASMVLPGALVHRAADHRSSLPMPADSDAPPSSTLVVDLGNVEAFSNVPPDEALVVARTATVHRLGPADRLTGFGLACILHQEVRAFADDATIGVPLGPGSVLRPRNEGPYEPAVTLVPNAGTAIVATWSRAQVDAFLASCPWVDDDLVNASHRAHALVGACLGPLGRRLDGPFRDQLFDAMALSVIAPGGAVALPGAPLEGLVVVGTGSLVCDTGGPTPTKLGPGALLLPTLALVETPVSATVHAGPFGAVLLVAPRSSLRELVDRLPALAALLAASPPPLPPRARPPR